MPVMHTQIIKATSAVDTTASGKHLVISDDEILGKILALDESCVVEIIIQSTDPTGRPGNPLGYRVNIDQGCK